MALWPLFEKKSSQARKPTIRTAMRISAGIIQGAMRTSLAIAEPCRSFWMRRGVLQRRVRRTHLGVAEIRVAPARIRKDEDTRAFEQLGSRTHRYRNCRRDAED